MAQNHGKQWIIWIPVLIVGIPLAHAAIRQEIARWYMAAAFDSSLRADLDSAIRLSQQAASWQEGDVNIEDRQLSWLLKAKRFDEAVTLAEQLLTVAKRQYEAGQTAATIHDYAKALNDAAYARAEARKGLRRAKDQIDEALILPVRIDELTRALYLDTRGFVAYLLNDNAAAQADLDWAIRLIDRSFGMYVSASRRQDQVNLEPRLARRDEINFREAVAVIYRHRALLHRRRGRIELADRDLAQANRIEKIDE